jgi:hypothetical protein
MASDVIGLVGSGSDPFQTNDDFPRLRRAAPMGEFLV